MHHAPLANSTLLNSLMHARDGSATSSMSYDKCSIIIIVSIPHPLRFHLYYVDRNRFQPVHNRCVRVRGYGDARGWKSDLLSLYTTLLCYYYLMFFFFYSATCVRIYFIFFFFMTTKIVWTPCYMAETKKSVQPLAAKPIIILVERRRSVRKILSTS